ncbi:hypothetical protein LCGC14_0424730 [marine sediment metagenome]|uniref:Uncharacterized protein n=1 Tax=marine sediment metagenome TaxID=412755 RepID=A0A0F9VBW8_9ZZZZ
MTTSPHGGARKGAGRPRELDGVTRTTITLSANDVDWLLSFAISHALSGVSAAVRQLIEDRKLGNL